MLNSSFSSRKMGFNNLEKNYWKHLTQIWLVYLIMIIVIVMTDLTWILANKQNWVTIQGSRVTIFFLDYRLISVDWLNKQTNEFYCRFANNVHPINKYGNMDSEFDSFQKKGSNVRRTIKRTTYINRIEWIIIIIIYNNHNNKKISLIIKVNYNHCSRLKRKKIQLMRANFTMNEWKVTVSMNSNLVLWENVVVVVVWFTSCSNASTTTTTTITKTKQIPCHATHYDEWLQKIIQQQGTK